MLAIPDFTNSAALPHNNIQAPAVALIRHCSRSTHLQSDVDGCVYFCYGAPHDHLPWTPYMRQVTGLLLSLE